MGKIYCYGSNDVIIDEDKKNIAYSSEFRISKWGDDEPYVYFVLKFGLRNPTTGEDKKVYGRMEKEDFDKIITLGKTWHEWVKNYAQKTFNIQRINQF